MAGAYPTSDADAKLLGWALVAWDHSNGLKIWVRPGTSLEGVRVEMDHWAASGQLLPDPSVFFARVAPDTVADGVVWFEQGWGTTTGDATNQPITLGSGTMSPMAMLLAQGWKKSGQTAVVDHIGYAEWVSYDGGSSRWLADVTVKVPPQTADEAAKAGWKLIEWNHGYLGKYGGMPMSGSKTYIDPVNGNHEAFEVPADNPSAFAQRWVAPGYGDSVGALLNADGTLKAVLPTPKTADEAHGNPQWELVTADPTWDTGTATYRSLVTGEELTFPIMREPKRPNKEADAIAANWKIVVWDHDLGTKTYLDPTGVREEIYVGVPDTHVGPNGETHVWAAPDHGTTTGGAVNGPMEDDPRTAVEAEQRHWLLTATNEAEWYVEYTSPTDKTYRLRFPIDEEVANGLGWRLLDMKANNVVVIYGKKGSDTYNELPHTTTKYEPKTELEAEALGWKREGVSGSDGIHFRAPAGGMIILHAMTEADAKAAGWRIMDLKADNRSAEWGLFGSALSPRWFDHVAGKNEPLTAAEVPKGWTNGPVTGWDPATGNRGKDGAKQKFFAPGGGWIEISEVNELLLVGAGQIMVDLSKDKATAYYADHVNADAATAVPHKAGVGEPKDGAQALAWGWSESMTGSSVALYTAPSGGSLKLTAPAKTGGGGASPPRAAPPPAAPQKSFALPAMMAGAGFLAGGPPGALVGAGIGAYMAWRKK